MGEAAGHTYAGLTHTCDDPDCHVGGFVRTLRRVADEAGQGALARVGAYADAVPTLYDEGNPMPDGLTIDTATSWPEEIRGVRLVQHDLTYADLLTLLDLLRADTTAEEATQ